MLTRLIIGLVVLKLGQKAIGYAYGIGLAAGRLTGTTCPTAATP